MTGPRTAEQQARALLARIGVKGVDSFSSADIVELANLIGEREAAVASVGTVVPGYRQNASVSTHTIRVLLISRDGRCFDGRWTLPAPPTISMTNRESAPNWKGTEYRRLAAADSATLEPVIYLEKGMVSGEEMKSQLLHALRNRRSDVHQASAHIANSEGRLRELQDLIDMVEAW